MSSSLPPWAPLAISCATLTAIHGAEANPLLVATSEVALTLLVHLLPLPLLSQRLWPPPIRPPPPYLVRDPGRWAVWITAGEVGISLSNTSTCRSKHHGQHRQGKAAATRRQRGRAKGGHEAGGRGGGSRPRRAATKGAGGGRRQIGWVEVQAESNAEAGGRDRKKKRRTRIGD